MKPVAGLSIPRLLSAAALVVASMAAAGCDSSFYGALGNKVTVGRLAISPSSATVPVNGPVTFAATGGAPPYVFSVASGFGSINASTGAYTASATAGTETVQVRDKQGTTSQATVTVTSTAGPLALTPPAVTLNGSGNLMFVGSGGTPPYTFSIQTAGSGPPAPSINATTGAYTAGSSVGTDTVKVTDSVAATATASVTVTAVSSSVNYQITSPALPTGGVGGTALPGGYSFTLNNAGTANGGQPVSWWVFLSATPTPGSGMILLQSGTASALGAGASTAVPLSWTWPAVPPVLPGQTRYLYLMISAADDLTTSNNTYTSSSLTVAPPDIDYTVATVSSTGGTQAGSAISGSFTLQNSGTAGGAQGVTWTAYVSANSTATIDAGASVVDSGSTGALAASGSQGVPFTGIWPTGAGTYYLKVAVSSADDVNTTNNVQVSPAYVMTNVDYSLTVVSNTGGLVAGAALAGGFTLTNSGSANGSQPVSWEAYASTTPTLGGGSTLVASGSTSALNVGQSTPVSFSGTWPSAAGSYYLISKVAAVDDPNTVNNQLSSTVLTVSPPSVDYAISSVTVAGGGSTDPAGAMSGTLQFTNNGPNAGTQYVAWQVFASKDAILDGSDVQIASGSYAPLAASGSSSAVPYAGSWPLTYGNYYVIARVTVPVDVDTNAANNTGASGSFTAVGFYTEVEPNDDRLTLTNPTILPLTLRPGMSVQITGSLNRLALPTADSWDVYQFNTGTATSVTLSMSWGASASVNMYVLISGGTSATGAGVSNATSLSLLWSPVDLPNKDRWIALNDASTLLAFVGTYTLIINAN